VRKTAKRIARPSVGPKREVSVSAEDSDGELHEAEGAVQPSDGFGAGVGGEAGIHEDIDLDGAGGDDRGDHQDEDFFYAGVEPAEIRAEAEAGAAEARKLDGKLEKTAHESSNRQAGERLASKGWVDDPAESHAAEDRADIEEARG